MEKETFFFSFKKTNTRMVKKHPHFDGCFAVMGTVSFARPAPMMQLLIAVRHSSRPSEVLRQDLPFAVVAFQQ